MNGSLQMDEIKYFIFKLNVLCFVFDAVTGVGGGGGGSLSWWRAQLLVRRSWV